MDINLDFSSLIADSPSSDTVRVLNESQSKRKRSGVFNEPERSESAGVFKLSPENHFSDKIGNEKLPADASSLGRWNFNKKKRKREYISLQGQRMEGAAAVRQSRLDKYLDRSTKRMELFEVNFNYGPLLLCVYLDLI